MKKKVLPIHERMRQKMEREKGKAGEVIGRYFDEKKQCMVTVLAGPSDPGFKTVPVGWSD